MIRKSIIRMNRRNFFAKGATGNLGAIVVGNPIATMGQEQYIGLAPLEGPYGERLQSQIRPSLLDTGSFAITDKNEHPEATIRWMDYFYSDEGARLFFMGIEGETFEETEDGQFVYVDSINNPADGLTQDQALAEYFTWLGGGYPGMIKQEFFQGSEGLPNAIEAGKKTEEFLPDEIWSSFSFDVEELTFFRNDGFRSNNFYRGNGSSICNRD